MHLVARERDWGGKGGERETGGGGGDGRGLLRWRKKGISPCPHWHVEPLTTHWRHLAASDGNDIEHMENYNLWHRAQICNSYGIEHRSYILLWHTGNFLIIFSILYAHAIDHKLLLYYICAHTWLRVLGVLDYACIYFPFLYIIFFIFYITCLATCTLTSGLPF
jgi:hypothetical protein